MSGNLDNWAGGVGIRLSWPISACIASRFSRARSFFANCFEMVAMVTKKENVVLNVGKRRRRVDSRL